MSQQSFPAAPGRRPLPRFLANIGIVVPVEQVAADVEESANNEDTSTVSSSVDSVDSSVVSDTDSEASADDADFSEAWIEAIEAATDFSEEHLRSLLLLLRTQRNHFPPSVPPPAPPSTSRNSPAQPRHSRGTRGQQGAVVSMRNSFQALMVSDAESDGEEQEARADVPVARAPSSSTRVQCRYLKVMIKVNISDVRRRFAQDLFEQKRWSEAADSFVTAHDQLHKVMVRFSLPCCASCTVFSHLRPFHSIHRFCSGAARRLVGTCFAIHRCSSGRNRNVS